MDKKYIIAGNWKMNKTAAESIDFVKALDAGIERLEEQAKIKKIEILVYPPFTSLFPLKGISRRIKIGAQNIFFEEKGAYTGEISPLMLHDLVDYVLIGHSERRHIFKEGDFDINKKIKTTLKHGFIPMLCVGEILAEREAGHTLSRIKEQLDADLDGLEPGEIDEITLAYEPVWAIGTGRNAAPEQAQEVHALIREWLKERTANFQGIPILYGGSVKPENSREILAQKDIDGVLVGGASLQVDSFSAIISHAIKLLDQ